MHMQQAKANIEAKQETTDRTNLHIGFSSKRLPLVASSLVSFSILIAAPSDEREALSTLGSLTKLLELCSIALKETVITSGLTSTVC